MGHSRPRGKLRDLVVANDAGKMFVSAYPAPTFPLNYTVAGVEDGTYQVKDIRPGASGCS